MAISTYLVHVHLHCFHQIISSSVHSYNEMHVVYIDSISLFSIINFLSAYRSLSYPRHQFSPSPPPPPPPGGGTGSVPRIRCHSVGGGGGGGTGLVPRIRCHSVGGGGGGGGTGLVPRIRCHSVGGGGGRQLVRCLGLDVILWGGGGGDWFGA